MKNQRGFIQIPILIAIIVGVLVLGGGGYLGVKKYQSFRAEKIENGKLAQEEQQQKDLVVENLKQEVEILKNRKPEVITQTIIRETPPTVKEMPVEKSGNSIASVVQYWRPVIAHIECDAYSTDQFGNISKIGVVSGSGTAQYFQSTGQYGLYTNKHVTSSSGGKSCRIQFPDNNSIIISIRGRLNPAANTDFAIVDIPSLEEKLGSVVRNTSADIASFCFGKPSVGDQVAILGYPGIGSATDITVTEGIISGYDGHYFITSAKVEHGNSGGAAILVKDNCYLGIPTFVQTGTLESLARILDWHKFDGQ